MPELPEVETVCRGIAAAIEGRAITAVEVRRADLRFPLPADFAERVAGQRVREVGRRAKYILISLANNTVILGHLGMSGRIYIEPSKASAPGRHDHLRFEVEGGAVVTFNDTRRFGFFDLCDGDALDDHPRLQGLGPEPLGNQFNVPVLAAALVGRATPIKAALLDQRVVAGLGNIYVSEALWRAGVSPRRKAASVPGRRAERLVVAIRDVLNDAIAAGGSTLRDYAQTNGELGYFQHRFAVYDREGELCANHCGGQIRRIVQSGRSTFYCPTCQR